VVELGEDHRAHAIGVLLAGKDDKERIKIEGVRWGLDRDEEGKARRAGLVWAARKTGRKRGGHGARVGWAAGERSREVRVRFSFYFKICLLSFCLANCFEFEAKMRGRF
jgi:hypothetical protein